MTIKNKLHFDFSKQTYVMGILNVTPDSFSDGGKFNEVERAVAHAKQMVEMGAHIIDIGAESTRPGAKTVSAEEEMERALPIIRAVKEAVDVPISIDTYKSRVAQAALEAGASVLNDVWGAKADPEMAKVAADYRVPIILMHNRDNIDYGEDLIEDMLADLRESIQICKEAGVTDDQMIIDPGIGFAKTYEHNLEVMRRLDELHVLGYPILLATSRKSFIGQALDLRVDERLEGTGASVCLGIAKGCQIVRVHDVLPIARMVRMMDVMLGKGRT